MIRAVIALALGDLRLTSKERFALVWMLLMPVAFIGLFGTFMGKGDRPQPVTLGVSDRDQSFLSGQFVEHLQSEGFTVVPFDSATAKPEQTPGRVLTIPSGFSDSLAAGDRVALDYRTRQGSPDDRNTAAEIHVQKSVARMLSILAEMDTTGDTPQEERRLPVQDAAFQERYRSMRARPDLVEVAVSTAGKGRAVPSGFAASAPAMLVLFVLINTVIYGAVLLTLEKQNGCLRRLAGQPVSRFGLLLGKLAGRLLLALCQSAIVVIAGHLLFHVYWGPSLLALLALIFCLGMACASIGLFLGAILRSPEQASAVGWIIPLFLAAIGGCWWPLEVVPHWMRVAGHVSPAAWAMDGLHGLISFGQGGAVVIVPCLILLGYGALFLTLGARNLRVE
jgi:ABC-2 type transport system permease protein